MLTKKQKQKIKQVHKIDWNQQKHEAGKEGKRATAKIKKKKRRKTLLVRINKKWHTVLKEEAKEWGLTMSKRLDYVFEACFGKKQIKHYRRKKKH